MSVLSEHTINNYVLTTKELDYVTVAKRNFVEKPNLKRNNEFMFRVYKFLNPATKEEEKAEIQRNMSKNQISKLRSTLKSGKYYITGTGKFFMKIERDVC